MRIGLRRLSSEQAVALAVVGATTAFVLWQFYPEYVFRDTTPVSADLASHLPTPAHLRDLFLPRGRLSGFSQSWYGGYPSLTFYFPFPNLVVVLFDLLLPYNIAYKFTATLGPLATPVVAYAFGRLNQRSRLTAACYGAATLAVLLQPLLWRLGGSIGSASIGEYSYGFGFTLSLLALGLAGAGLRTGGYRALTSVVLAAALLSHVVPAATALIGIALLTAIRPSWAKVRWTATVGATAAALGGVWLLPLLLRLRLTAGPDAPSAESWSHWLWPSEMAPIAFVAIVGLVFTGFAAATGYASRRNDVELFMALMGITSFLLFTVMPKVPVEDLRFLPCWYLWLSLLAGNAVARLAELVDRRRAERTRGRPFERPALVGAAAPIALLLLLLPLWKSRLSDGVLTQKGKGDAVQIAKFGMIGLERTPGRVELQAFVDALRRVARERGCGRALGEWSSDDWSAVRLPMTDLSAHWTDGCITAARNVIPQTAATSPFVITANERLSFDPVQMEGEPERFDLEAGLADLRILGFRYYIATHRRTQAAADRSPELRLVAETDEYDNHRWRIYELSDVPLVEPLRYEPVVVPSAGGSRRSWERTARPWFDTGPEREVVLAEDGPASWRRTDDTEPPFPRRSVDGTTVRNVRVEHERVRFDVSTTGTPVLVKVSYFPNWRADGADGPWRVTPNHMVVVPRARTVTLEYGRTAADNAGLLATVAGMGGVVALARRPPVEPVVPAEPPPEPAARRPRKPAPPKRKKRR